MNDFKACTCAECVACCKRTPGWFAPGEAERAAKLLGLDFEEFYARHLVTDYWITFPGTVDVLAPFGERLPEPSFRVVLFDEELPGTRVSSGYQSALRRCTFLDEQDRCRIHEAKPIECRETMGCADVQESQRERIAGLWAKESPEEDR